MSLLRPLATLAVLVCPAVVLAQAIDAKTGLWETTVKVDMAGMASMVDTSKMSPEQKARVEAMMANMGNAGPRQHASQSCVTAEDLKSSPIGSDADCQYTFTTRTSTKVAGTVSCTKHGSTQTGDFAFEARSREAVAGTMHLQMQRTGAQPGSANVSMEMNSRWLGNDCGDVKPRSAKAR